MNKRNPKPVANDKVQLIIDNKVWYDTKIVDALASQFTVLVNHKVKFFFYVDEGDTWKRKAS